MTIFPKVKKSFTKIVATERLKRETVKVIAAALFAAGAAIGVASPAKANTGQENTLASTGRVIVLTVAPSLTLSDGTSIVQVADHSSHSSHASHASHASHCSGYTYCG